ncbi:MAG: hypothetical protein KGH98_04060 [Candidatus Micrarchaeota archaeon]|nr:hypothetical protein [Candidatus Micrarchaeota archaeon]
MNASKFAVLSLAFVLVSIVPFSGAQSQIFAKIAIPTNLTFNMSLNSTAPVQTMLVPFGMLGNASAGNGITVLSSIGWPMYTNSSGAQSQLLGDQIITAFHPFYGHIPFYGNFTITVFRTVRSGVYQIPVNAVGPVPINTTITLTLNNPNNVNGSISQGGVQPVSSQGGGGVPAATAETPGNSANSVVYGESVIIVVLVIVVVALLRGRRKATA